MRLRPLPERLPVLGLVARDVKGQDARSRYIFLPAGDAVRAGLRLAAPVTRPA
ncbi:MAG: hypothetical protein NHG36_08585 [Chromatiaceae bacterium]|nr:hypothetical protein [Candidatus Thioaporhodococcus sediminis]